MQRLIDTIFIISWFGNDTVKDKRKKQHLKQIKWAFDNELKIVILPQKYNECDYIKDSNITYLTQPSELFYPSKARNELLKVFYSTDLKMSVFADNDTILCLSELEQNFFNNINNNFEKYSDIDLIIPSWELDKPRIILNKNPELYNNNYVFKKSAVGRGAFFILRNIKSFYNKELYFDDFFHSLYEGKSLRFGEDLEFAIRCIFNGLGVYKAMNVIMNTPIGKKANTTINFDDLCNNRNETYKHIMSNYYRYGLEKDKRGYLTYRKFMKNLFRKPDTIIIQRQKI